MRGNLRTPFNCKRFPSHTFRNVHWNRAFVSRSIACSLSRALCLCATRDANRALLRRQSPILISGGPHLLNSCGDVANAAGPGVVVGRRQNRQHGYAQVKTISRLIYESSGVGAGFIKTHSHRSASQPVEIPIYCPACKAFLHDDIVYNHIVEVMCASLMQIGKNKHNSKNINNRKRTIR